MLAEDRSLLLRREPREGAGASEGIPDGPGPRGVEHGPPRPHDEPVLQVGLEAARVRAAEHGELGLAREGREGLGAQDLALARGEEGGILGEGEHADPARVVEIGVEHGLELASLERGLKRLGLGAAAEGLELHEEPSVAYLSVGAALRYIGTGGERRRSSPRPLCTGTGGEWRRRSSPSPPHRIDHGG